ncbi:MAG: hypothetical protein AB7D57_04680 [Desulfovibrionaceae bacterium]
MPIPPPSATPEQATLLELLDGIDDPGERERLVRAWKALAPLARVVQMPPRPTGRLAGILDGPGAVGDELDGHDLGMVVGGSGPAPAAAPAGEAFDLAWLAGAGPEPAADACPAAPGDGRDARRRPDEDQGEDENADESADEGSDASALLLGDDEDDAGGDAGRPAPTSEALLGDDDGDVFLFGDDDGDALIPDFDPARDRLRFAGLRGPDDLDVARCETGTLVTFRRTRLLLQGLQLDAARVLGLVDDD